MHSRGLPSERCACCRSCGRWTGTPRCRRAIRVSGARSSTGRGDAVTPPEPRPARVVLEPDALPVRVILAILALTVAVSAVSVPVTLYELRSFRSVRGLPEAGPGLLLQRLFATQ